MSIRRKPDKIFVKELKLINKVLDAVWFTKYSKWFIVRPASRRVPGMTEYDPISGKTYFVELVLEEKGHTVELTARTLEAVRLMYRRGNMKLDEAFREVDDEERKRIDRALKENELRFKGLGKKLYRFMKTDEVVLGG
jgi:hypothetical protein